MSVVAQAKSAWRLPAGGPGRGPGGWQRCALCQNLPLALRTAVGALHHMPRLVYAENLAPNVSKCFSRILSKLCCGESVAEV